MTSFPINPDQVTRQLAEMVAINSINPTLVPGGAGEAEIAGWLCRTCEAMGLQVRTQDAAPGRPNVIARWPGRGGGRSLLLTGHTDVVGVENMSIPPFEPRIENGLLYGRGTLDMKGGLASILGAVQALRQGGFEPRGDILLGFVADEEHSSLGTQALAQEVKADAAILAEPSGLNICVAHRGFAWLAVETRGLAAHGSLYMQGVDAIAHMGRVLSALEKMDQDTLSKRSHRLLGRPSVHASLIEGGLGLSTYPDRCTLHIEHRLLPDETGDNVLALWQGALGRLSQADPKFSASVTLTLTRPGYEIAEDAPVVQVIRSVFVSQIGQEPAMSGMLAWLDSALLGAAGIPTVIFGPGGEGAHAAVEYVDLADVHRCAGVIAAAAAEWTA